MVLIKTGFDEDRLNCFKLILGVITSQNPVNVEAFRLCSKDTAKKHIEKYYWYYMSLSLNVILMHSWQIMDKVLLPMGLYSKKALLGMEMFSEEAQEGYHEFLKRFKNRLSRKMFRCKYHKFYLYFLYYLPYWK